MNGGLLQCTGGSDQDHLQEKEMQKGKMVVWGLTNSWEKFKAKEKRKDKLIWMHSSKQCHGDKKAFLSDQFKETVENNRTGMTRDLFKRLEKPREHLIQRWTQ